jgi:hypothetical protein
MFKKLPRAMEQLLFGDISNTVKRYREMRSIMFTGATKFLPWILVTVTFFRIPPIAQDVM